MQSSEPMAMVRAAYVPDAVEEVRDDHEEGRGGRHARQREQGSAHDTDGTLEFLRHGSVGGANACGALRVSVIRRFRSCERCIRAERYRLRASGDQWFRGSRAEWKLGRNAGQCLSRCGIRRSGARRRGPGALRTR
ncbi:hypothetical protein GCM10019017_21720 [Streptomyces showdoensis]